jgi:hypothetical protein
MEIIMSKDAYRIKQVLQASITSASLFVLVACGGYGNPPVSSSGSGMTLARALAKGYISTTCPAPVPGRVTCLAYQFTPAGLQALGIKRSTASSLRKTSGSLSDTPGGTDISIQQVRAAYGLTTLSASGGVGQTVAAIEVGNAPWVESDLGVYRSYFGFPSCTIANGCLRMVAQNGSSQLPASNPSWWLEVTNDVSAISGVCPNCKILIVEANSSAWSDIAAAVNTAASMGVTSIDNSYAGYEDSSMLQYASAYNHPGIAVVASTMDAWYGPGNMLLPAAYSTVIAVGASNLTADPSTSRGWSETVSPWGSADGCSTIIAKPAWQHDTGCSMRTVADIAFASNPGFPVYGHGMTAGNGAGWGSGDGTSFATAAVAGLYGLAGAKVNDASSLYYGASQLNSIASGSVYGLPSGQGGCIPLGGSSGNTVTDQSSLRRGLTSSDLPAYFCTGEAGYSSPVGNGSPNGTTPLTATPAPTVTPCPLPTASSPNPHPTQNPNPGSACTS